MPKLPSPEDYGFTFPSVGRSISTVSPVVDSGAIGKALTGLGESIAHETHKMDTLKAQEALNTLQAEKDRLSAEANSVLGADVLNPDFRAKYTDLFNSRFDAATSSLSPAQVALARPHFQKLQLGFGTDLLKHSITQSHKAEVDVSAATIGNQTATLATTIDPAEFGKREALAEAAINKHATVLGYGQNPEVVESLRRKYLAPVYETAITTALGQGNISRAEELHVRGMGQGKLDLGSAVRTKRIIEESKGHRQVMGAVAQDAGATLTERDVVVNSVLAGGATPAAKAVPSRVMEGPVGEIASRINSTIGQAKEGAFVPPPDMVARQIQAESSGQWHIVSSEDAYGLFQIKNEFATDAMKSQGKAFDAKLFREDSPAGRAYQEEVYKVGVKHYGALPEVEGRADKFYAAYVAGPGNLRKAVKAFEAYQKAEAEGKNPTPPEGYESGAVTYLDFFKQSSTVKDYLKKILGPDYQAVASGGTPVKGGEPASTTPVSVGVAKEALGAQLDEKRFVTDQAYQKEVAGRVLDAAVSSMHGSAADIQQQSVAALLVGPKEVKQAVGEWQKYTEAVRKKEAVESPPGYDPDKGPISFVSFLSEESRGRVQEAGPKAMETMTRLRAEENVPPTDEELRRRAYVRGFNSQQTETYIAASKATFAGKKADRERQHAVIEDQIMQMASQNPASIHAPPAQLMGRLPFDRAAKLQRDLLATLDPNRESSPAAIAALRADPMSAAKMSTREWLSTKAGLSESALKEFRELRERYQSRDTKVTDTLDKGAIEGRVRDWFTLRGEDAKRNPEKLLQAEEYVKARVHRHQVETGGQLKGVPLENFISNVLIQTGTEKGIIWDTKVPLATMGVKGFSANERKAADAVFASLGIRPTDAQRVQLMQDARTATNNRRRDLFQANPGRSAKFRRWQAEIDQQTGRPFENP